MDVQKLEYDADFRIKFASINAKGGLDGDAHHPEYELFFAELPNDWTRHECPNPIETRFEWRRRAWVLRHSHSGTEIAAVEHETGIEILVAIGAGLATEALVVLIKWGWGKWKATRANLPNKVEPSLILENVSSRTPDGRILTIGRLEMRGPLTSEEVARQVESALGPIARS
jgi:hypothetical protein